MNKIFEKFSNKIAAIIAICIAGLSFLNAIFIVVDGGAGFIGELCNSFVLAAICALLAYFLMKDNKEKVNIVVILLIGALILSTFGNSITCFANAGDTGGGLYTVISVFVGLSLLGAFTGAVCHFIPKITDKVPAQIFTLIATIGYFVGAGFAVISGILYLFVDMGGNAGMHKVTLLFGELITGAELFLLAVLANKNS